MLTLLMISEIEFQWQMITSPCFHNDAVFVFFFCENYMKYILYGEYYD